MPAREKIFSSNLDRFHRLAPASAYLNDQQTTQSTLRRIDRSIETGVGNGARGGVQIHDTRRNLDLRVVEVEVEVDMCGWQWLNSKITLDSTRARRG